MSSVETSLAPSSKVPFITACKAFSNSRQGELALTIGAYLLAFAVLWSAVFRIDFHADEAIYLCNVPIGMGNDTGLVFHSLYLLGSWGSPTPGAGRVTSLVLGLALIGFVSASFRCWLPQHRRILPALVALLVTFSYQGVFLILRVRPELSWVVASAMVVCFLAYAETTKRPLYIGLALFALLLLPMNHRLVWFPCAFLTLYLPIFARRSLGWRFAIMGMAAMFVGAVLNVVLRAWLSGHTLGEAWTVFTTSAVGGERRDFFTFCKFVFWNAAQFLRDIAATRSWWDRILPAGVREYLSHYYFAGLLWVAAFALPWLAKSWQTRFIMGFPTFAFVLFQISGYYNPTYSAIFALYGVLIALYIAFDQAGWRRGIAIAVMVLSLFNGLSFLSTRVWNHDKATYFAVEKELRTFFASLPPDTAICFNERYLPAALQHRGPKSVLFHRPIPTNTQYIILDDYDFEMYKFVKDYDSRRQELENALRTCQSLREFQLPTYGEERQFAVVPPGERPPTLQGSWFFRNSVTTRTVILAPTAQAAAESPTKR